MSHATLCRDTHLDRDVIVKELQAGQEQRRLMDEVAALGAVRSKHVVQIYDVVRNNSGEVVGLVEEFIPGDDLETLIPVTDAAQFLRIAYGIACGIADIHAVQVVHRDIKPNNIKFDAEGCPKIFDFGLARGNSTGDAATQGPVGTRGYMSPEICVEFDEQAALDQPVDVYAFGATLLKVIRGRLPPQLRAFPPVLPCQDADFSSQPLAVPGPVAVLANACLATSPADRPTMVQVRDAIGAELLRDEHKATFVFDNQIHVLSAARRSVTITIPRLGIARVSYDGLKFTITPTSGDVYVNNMVAVLNQPYILPGSCVLTFGGPALGWSRRHIPLDVSHPEVVL
jgi:serine/threonine-protein kinase